MSGIPPQLDVEPGTPTGEWAVKTTSALQPEPAGIANATSTNPTTAQLFEAKNMRPGTTTETSMASAASTPDNEFPGAFPHKQEAKPVGSDITDTVTETANKVAQTVAQTAQVYVPAAAEKIGQYLPKSVADKMSEYIPGMNNPQGTVRASEHDVPHIKSLPSTELTGAGPHEHVGGVGALPGSLAERSVTKLPDERLQTVVPATLAGAAVAATEAAKGTAEKVQSTAYDAKDRAMHGGHTTAIGPSSVPSHELDGAKPGDHSSGVGALPGSINEFGVARLPDEGGRGNTGATSASIGTHAKLFGAATLPSHDDSSPELVTGGVGSLPGHNDEGGVALLPDERLATQPSAPLAAPGLPSKTGETEHLAETARQEGIASAQSHQPSASERKKEEGKVGAAVVGAAVGEKVAKDEHAKSEQKMAVSGQPNKLMVASIKDGNEEKQADLLHANLSPRTHVLASDGVQWAGQDLGGDKYHRGEGIDLTEGDMYDTDYHPSQLHPPNADYSKDHTQPAQERDKEREPAGEKEQEKHFKGATHTDSQTSSHTQGSSTDENEKAKKVGFMAKMKGEAKILLGKMEGKKGHEKVEEGQKIKSGEATETH